MLAPLQTGFRQEFPQREGVDQATGGVTPAR